MRTNTIPIHWTGAPSPLTCCTIALIDTHFQTYLLCLKICALAPPSTWTSSGAILRNCDEGRCCSHIRSDVNWVGVIGVRFSSESVVMCCWVAGNTILFMWNFGETTGGGVVIATMGWWSRWFLTSLLLVFASNCVIITDNALGSSVAFLSIDSSVGDVPSSSSVIVNV